MSATESTRPELPPTREELAVAPTQALRPDDPPSELASLLDNYLAELQSGRQPDRVKLLAEHPGLAAQLEQCLSGIEFIHRASGSGMKSGMPTQLGDFRIVREVGRGGMGVVYEAEQISLKRRVALKVLRFGAASDVEAMQRFQREAETVAGLHHTNIVPIFAIGCENGVNYYAMQFIEGRSLAAFVVSPLGGLQRENTPPEGGTTNVANWGLQAAEALAHAHHRGVIHRDIKPSNLILDPDGRIWLTDFGLAKRMDDVSLSMAGAILGTPRYMSPEQAAATTNPVDHRTDIYSLGATLYELATGRPLFEGDSPHAVITQILTSEPPTPRVVCPNLHRDFETIILKCLSKEPERRYATAQALADDLRAFVEGRAIKARRSTLAEQAARWFKQQKRSVGIAAATVAATIFVVIGSLIAWQMHGQSRLGYLTLNTPREGNERAEVAEVLTLDDQPVGSPFTLPTKEPLALPEGAYRLRLTAPTKVSQTYLFDIASGAHQTHEVGLVNETVGYAIPLRSPVGVEVVQRSRHAPRDEPSGTRDRTPQGATENQTTKAPHAEREGYFEPRLFVGPQDQSKPTNKCYSVSSQPQQHTVQEGSSINVVRSTEPTPLWEADWRLEAPDIVSFLKLPADREAWKVLPAQTDVFAWQQVLAWFDPSWFRNGTPPKVMQPARDLNGDGVEDVIWSAPQLANRQQGSFGPGPLTPKAAVLVAASGKDGKPLWWFRPQDSNGGASWLMTAPVWASDGASSRTRESSDRSLTTSATNDATSPSGGGDVLVCALRSMNGPETWLEAISAKSGETLWRTPVPHSAGTIQQSVLNSAVLEAVMPSGRDADSKPFVVAAVVRKLMAVDVATGKTLWEPHDFGEGLQRPPRFADLDGDGVVEVLSIAPPVEGVPQLTATSLSDRRPLWNAPVTWFPNNSASPWPSVVDLDDDGRGEVVLPNNKARDGTFGTGVQVLDGQSGKPRWSRRFPINRGQSLRTHSEADQYAAGPDLDGDGQRELFMTSIRMEWRAQTVGPLPSYRGEEYFLYVDCFSGRDGKTVWWQRIPLGSSEHSRWTGKPETPIWWGESSPVAPRPESRMAADSQSSNQASKSLDRSAVLSRSDRATLPRLVLPVRRHADWEGDGIGNAGERLLFVLSAETGRVEHSAENLALPQLVDWNNDGLDDLAVFVPDDPAQFAHGNSFPDKPSGKFVVLRGSPPEAFRRLDRWIEEQDFDGDGIAELTRPSNGSGSDYSVLIASGRDGRVTAKWPVEWPETPRSFTVGNVHSFAPPLGDFDGDGLADLLITRDAAFWDWEFEHQPIVETGRIPLLMQAVSGKTGRRVWGGGEFTLPDAFRPTSADVNSESWMTMRFNRIEPRLTQAVDLDADGRPEVLQMLRLVGYGPSGQPGGGALSERQEPFVALIDGRSGTVRWFESVTAIMTGEQLAAKFGLPDFIKGGGTHAPGLDYLRIDASTDLNGDATRDLVLTVPQQLQQGSWLQTVQVHSGRDGKVLWGPKPLEGENFNNNDFNPPIVSDLDGDDRPELVLMAAKQPHVTVLRGDTGESLWTWQGSQPPYFAAPGIAVVAQRSRHAPRDEPNAPTTPNMKSSSTNHSTSSARSAPHAEREGYVERCVAVAFNETGSQWDIALLDHEGQLIERVPAASNQLWSHDLDGDGGEELLRQVDSTIAATRGLHDVLWTWSLTTQSYGSVPQIERTHDGRVIVVMSGNDSVTLLDGKTGQPLGRTWRSCNASLNENGRKLDLNRAKLNSAGEATRLLTRVGDGQVLLGHVVSRDVLPTDESGNYVRARSARVSDPAAATTAGLPNGRGDLRSVAVARSETGHSAADDPRLVRRLMWAPAEAEWPAIRIGILKQVLLAVGLSLLVVLTPYWLIRSGVRRRELGRWRIALIGGGILLLLTCLTLMRFPPPGSAWRETPWALPFVLAGGGLPILLYSTELLRALAIGDWRRLRWLLIATLILTVLLAAIQMGVDLSRKPPEQHYSWFGWWMIFVMGAYFTGICLVLGLLFGPSVRWLWLRMRQNSAKVVTH